MWCIQILDAVFRVLMYDILDLYEEPYDPKRPIVNVDEKPKQLLGDKRKSIPMRPGCSEKYDYEYIRKGTANIFVAVEIKAGKRFTQVTKRRTMKDFAVFIQKLVDEEYPDAEVIRIIADNLNTHKIKSFYETFSEDEAQRILSKIEFHYTPKHSSWLNAAEIEINIASPNKGGELPLPPLLRTVRDTFASYGSSNLQPGYRATVGKEIQLGLRFRVPGSCSIYPVEEIIPVQEWICIKSDLRVSSYFGV